MVSILWIGHVAPDPRTTGARVYSGGLMSALADAGAHITFVGLANPDAAATPTRADPRIDWRIVPRPERGTIPALASPLPIVAARASPPPVVATAENALQQRRLTAVVIDNYASGWVLDAIAAHAPGTPIVYVAHNDETTLARDIARAFRGDPLRRLALEWNAGKIRKLEHRLLRAASLVVAITERDRDSFRARSPATPSLVLSPGYSGVTVEARTIDAQTPRRVVMLGSMRWIAKRMNLEAFLDVADVRLADAGIALDLIGDAPEDFRSSFEGRLRATRFLGFVDDVSAELASARLGLVVEPTGGGFKLKVLDYIFHRLPIAALAGSCEGLPREVIEASIQADSLDALGTAIVDTIDDLPRLNAMQEAAYDAGRGAFDWGANGRRLLDALAKPAQARAS